MNAITLDSLSFAGSGKVRLNLDSVAVRDPREIVGRIVEGVRQHRLPLYVAYFSGGDVKRLRTMRRLFHLETTLLREKRVTLEEHLHMQIVELPQDPRGIEHVVLEAFRKAPSHDVCFIDVSMFADSLKGVDVSKLRRDLDDAMVAIEVKSNELAKTTLDAILGTEELAGWADESPDRSVAVAQANPIDAARQVRDRLLKSERWYDSKEVAIAARQAVVESNPSQYASRLRRERRLFGVRFRGEYLHPAFQFQASGEVHPAMATLLALLPATDANWNAAFWLYQPTGKLAGQRPADVFATDPNAVIAAARADFVDEDGDGTAVSAQRSAAHGS